MKTTTTIIAAIMAFVMLSVFASAAVDVTYDSYGAVYNANGNFVPSATPVNDVNAIGFVCADSSCSTVSGSLWNGQVVNTGSDNSVTLQYPTTLQSQFGYVVYHYKTDYVAWVQRSNWAGTGAVSAPVSTYQTKIESCKAPIDSFAVINDVYPNQPIMVNIQSSLDENTASPLTWNNVAGYHPAQLANVSQTQVTVTLTITNNAGQVVNTQQQVVTLQPASSTQVMFDYTPTVLGQYTARVSTSVTDAKCVSTDAQFAQKNFNVIAQNPTNQCYTLLNNLDVQPSNQVVGQPVTISFDKISNVYDAQGQLSTLSTAANIVVTQNGQTVATQQLVVPANANTVTPQVASTQFTPTSAGYYTVSVNGFTQNCPYMTTIADNVAQSFFAYNVNNTNNNTNTTNQAPVWLTVPGVTLQQNSGLNSNVLNLNLYVIDPDSNQLTFSIVSVSNPAVATCTVNAQTGSVSCTAPVGGPVGTSTITVGSNDGTTTSTSSFVVTVQANVNPNGACTGPNGVLIPNTGSQTFFQTANVPFGQTCVSQARTCSNGVLSGTFTFATCSVTPANTCVGPDGFNIADGSSRTYFQSAAVPVGQSCISELRQCNTGALTGTFSFPTCTVGGVTSLLVFDLPAQEFEVRRNSLDTLAIPDLTVYVINGRNLPLTFSLISQTGDVADCTLNGPTLTCDALHGQDGTDSVNLSVTDGVETQTDIALIGVGNYDKQSSRGQNYEGLVISQFAVADQGVADIQGGSIPVSLSIKNEMGHRLKDVTVTMSVLELGTWTKDGPFNLGSGNSKQVKLYIPVEDIVSPGMYTIRMTIADATMGLIRVEHRDLLVERLN